MNKDTPSKRHGKEYEYYLQIESLREAIDRIKKMREHLDEMEKGYKYLIEYFSELEDKDYKKDVVVVQKITINSEDIVKVIEGINNKVKQLRSKMNI